MVNRLEGMISDGLPDSLENVPRAPGRIRTADLTLTRGLLYQLSYEGLKVRKGGLGGTRTRCLLLARQALYPVSYGAQEVRPPGFEPGFLL